MQPLTELAALLEETEQQLALMVDDIASGRRLEAHVDFVTEGRAVQQDFPWPERAVHLLSLLQDGLGARRAEAPEGIRTLSAMLLAAAWCDGTLSDRRTAIQIAGIIPDAHLDALLVNAFHSPSQWLRDAAFRQAARLSSIGGEVAAGIRLVLVQLYAGRRLRRERLAMRAYLKRFGDAASDYLAILDLLLWVDVIDAGLYGLVLAAALVVLRLNGDFLAANVVSIVLAVGISIALGRMPSAGGAGRRLGARTSVDRMWVIMATMEARFVVVMLLMFSTSNDIARLTNSGSLAALYQTVISSRSSQPLLLVGMYAAIFLPLALEGARSGVMIRYYQWPALPVAPLAHLPRMWKATMSDLPYTLSRLLGVLLATGAVGLIVWLWFTVIAERSPLLYTIVNTVVIAVVAVGVGLRPVRFAVGWCHDRLRWHRSWAATVSTASAEDLLAEVRRFRTASFRLRLLRANRERNALELSADNDRLLTDMAIMLEAPRRDRSSAWFATADELDEVYRLRDQVRFGMVTPQANH